MRVSVRLNCWKGLCYLTLTQDEHGLWSSSITVLRRPKGSWWILSLRTAMFSEVRALVRRILNRASSRTHTANNFSTWQEK